jgi:uncharacterized protein (DUF849 family)
VDWLAAELLAYGIRPEIEVFDLSHNFKAADTYFKGQIKDVPYVQFVMGVKNATPADRNFFDFCVQTVHRLFGDVPWCAAGIGPNQIVLNDWAISSGGHARTGLEDNMRIDRDRFAPSHAALVGRTVEICQEYHRPVAPWQKVRSILGLRNVTWGQDPLILVRTSESPHQNRSNARSSSSHQWHSYQPCCSGHES